MHWHDRHPALLSPDRVAKQWNEIPAEKLPEVFQTPVCWDCYIAETFRRQNPDRVLDRTWQRGAGGEYVPEEGNNVEVRKQAAASCIRSRPNIVCTEPDSEFRLRDGKV
jgi:hypothetical protein